MKMTMRRILFVGNSSAAFLNHHAHLAGAMREEMEVHVAVPRDGDDNARLLAECGFRVHRLDLARRTVNPVRVLGEAMSVRRLIASIKPDIVNAITLKCLAVAALALAFPCALRSRLVGTVTGLGHLFAGDSAKRRVLRSATLEALRRALPRVRHTLVFSNADDRRLFFSRRVGESGSARVIPVPGVDTEAYACLPESPEGFRVALPARMLWEKGVGEFVAAAEILRRDGAAVDCVLAGGLDADNPAAIDAGRLREWEAGGAVRWIGHCGDMPGLLASTHVVCLPSYREGFPLALAEGMSCGRALATTDVPGCRDAVADSGAGILVPPRDPEALARALKALRADPGMRREMGRRGREAALGRFSQATVTAAMRHVLLDAG